MWQSFKSCSRHVDQSCYVPFTCRRLHHPYPSEVHRVTTMTVRTRKPNALPYMSTPKLEATEASGYKRLGPGCGDSRSPYIRSRISERAGGFRHIALVTTLQ